MDYDIPVSFSYTPFLRTFQNKIFVYGVSEALNMLKEHLKSIQRACMYFLIYRPNIMTFCASTVTTPGTRTALIPSSSISN